jgi:hypothetical protein
MGNLDIFENNDNIERNLDKNNDLVESQPLDNIPPTFFDMSVFVNNLEKKLKNDMLTKKHSNISGYDISSNCSKFVVMKLLNYPIKNDFNIWLPISLRGTIGRAIHNFIETNYDFTECERTLRVPSMMVWGIYDASFNNNVLVEIKSVPMFSTDYSIGFDTIVKEQKPRPEDFIQVLFYRYLLHNHLQEIQEQKLKNDSNKYGIYTPPPQFPKYDIKYFQFIYVAQDSVHDNMESIDQCIASINKIKKLFDSKTNKFYFMKTLTISTESFNINSYEKNFVTDKLNNIIEHVRNKTLPSDNNKFVYKNNPKHKSKCYFCNYNNIC